MNRTLIIKIAVVFLIVVLGGVWLTTKDSKKNEVVVSELAKITSGDHIKGDEDATVKLIEYGDFQCPSCKSYYPIVRQLAADYPGKLVLIFRHYPLTNIHRNAFRAAMAAEAAGKQGKFWEMHDKLFESQSEWSELGSPVEKFGEYAKGLKLDADKFAKDLFDEGLDQKVKGDLRTGNSLSVSGTPTFYINGQKIGLPGGLAQFKLIIDGELAKFPEAAQKTHEHFDFVLFEDGLKIDLTKEEFMEKNDKIHMHDLNAEVVHIHRKGATLGEFVTSVRTKEFKDVKLAVNGSEVVGDWKKYEPKDLDRVVLVMGNVTTGVLNKASTTVTDKACIYSEKCPERGKPPTENCVGGLDTDCVDDNLD